MQGVVVRLVQHRGFGFIEADGNDDIFLHAKAMPDREFDALEVGTQVEFDLTKDRAGRGDRAVNVRVVG